MPRTIRADEDTWKVRLGRDAPQQGMRTVLFFCQTTDQRPFRVVQVDADRVTSGEDLESLSEAELEELYRASVSMGAPDRRAMWGV